MFYVLVIFLFSQLVFAQDAVEAPWYESLLGSLLSSEGKIVIITIAVLAFISAIASFVNAISKFLDEISKQTKWAGDDKLALFFGKIAGVFAKVTKITSWILDKISANTRPKA